MDKFIEETAELRAANLAFSESLRNSRGDALEIAAIGQKYETGLALLTKGVKSVHTLYQEFRAGEEETRTLQNLNAGLRGELKEVERLRQELEQVKIARDEASTEAQKYKTYYSVAEKAHNKDLENLKAVIAERDQLKSEYKTLSDSNQQLTTERDILRTQLASPTTLQNALEAVVSKVISGYLSPHNVQTAIVKAFRDMIIPEVHELWFTDHDQMKDDILKIVSGAIESNKPMSLFSRLTDVEDEDSLVNRVAIQLRANDDQLKREYERGKEDGKAESDEIWKNVLKAVGSNEKSAPTQELASHPAPAHHPPSTQATAPAQPFRRPRELPVIAPAQGGVLPSGPSTDAYREESGEDGGFNRVGTRLRRRSPEFSPEPKRPRLEPVPSNPRLLTEVGLQIPISDETSIEESVLSKPIKMLLLEKGEKPRVQLIKANEKGKATRCFLAQEKDHVYGSWKDFSGPCDKCSSASRQCVIFITASLALLKNPSEADKRRQEIHNEHHGAGDVDSQAVEASGSGAMENNGSI